MRTSGQLVLFMSVQPVLGEVVDMSAGGVSVLTWDALPVHKELYLSFGPPGQRERGRR